MYGTMNDTSAEDMNAKRHTICWKATDILEEHIAFIFRAEE
jgi:hypothetical protein